MTTLDLIENPVLDELVTFAGNNKNVGPRWAALHALLTERVLPARAEYRSALDAAAKEKTLMEARHADALKTRESLVEQINGIDRAIAEQFPSERDAVAAAPARIAEKANASLSKGEASLISAAIESYKTFGA
jgi:hypothetical protein